MTVDSGTAVSGLGSWMPGPGTIRHRHLQMPVYSVGRLDLICHRYVTESLSSNIRRSHGLLISPTTAPEATAGYNQLPYNSFSLHNHLTHHVVTIIRQCQQHRRVQRQHLDSRCWRCGWLKESKVLMERWDFVTLIERFQSTATAPQ